MKIKQILEPSFRMSNVHFQIEPDGTTTIWRNKIRLLALVEDEGEDMVCQLDTQDDEKFYSDVFFPEKDDGYLGTEYDDEKKPDDDWSALAMVKIVENERRHEEIEKRIAQRKESEKWA